MNSCLICQQLTSIYNLQDTTDNNWTYIYCGHYATSPEVQFHCGTCFLPGHGGRVMQICISKLTIIDSDNGLVSYIFISEKSFENVCKMSTILCWPQNVLIHFQCDGTFVYSVEYTSKIGIETCKMDNVFHPDNPRFGSGTECSWIRWSYIIIIHMYAYTCLTYRPDVGIRIVLYNILVQFVYHGSVFLSAPWKFIQMIGDVWHGNCAAS